MGERGRGQYGGNKAVWLYCAHCDAGVRSKGVCVFVCVPVLCVAGSLAGRKSSSYESSLDSSPSTEDQALNLASAMANCSATPARVHTHTNIDDDACKYTVGMVTRRQRAMASRCCVVTGRCVCGGEGRAGARDGSQSVVWPVPQDGRH